MKRDGSRLVGESVEMMVKIFVKLTIYMGLLSAASASWQWCS